MSTEKRMPVLHRVFTGELKHHFLLKDGRLGFQKSALTAQSIRQRIGYQMLIDESGAAFVDLYPVDATRMPRLPLVFAFLPLAWSAPVIFEESQRTIGLPNVLSVSSKAVSAAHYEVLSELGRLMDFQLESPRSGFDAGVHLIKELGKGIDSTVGIGGAKDTDWTAGDNMKILSFLVAVNITTNLKLRGPMHPLRAMAILTNTVYEHRPVPSGWLGKFAQRFGKSELELKEYCFPYFDKDYSFGPT